MSADEFWELVELCKKDPEATTQKIEQFTEEQFTDLCWIYEDYAVELKDPEMFEQLADETVSEDHMEDLAWWCVNQGKKFYEEVFKNPSLMPTTLPDNKTGVYSIALKIYLDRYGDYPYSPDVLQTEADLRKYIEFHVKEKMKDKRNLEYYLLALLKQVEAVKDRQLLYRDIMIFLRNSYKGEMADYSNDWVKLPTDLSKSDINNNEEAYNHFVQTLKVCIADLHYIRTSLKHAFISAYKSDAKGAKGRGHLLWQHTDVAGFLIAGASSLSADEENHKGKSGRASWDLFESILLSGITKM
jgi:hypothetical protein